MFVGTLLTPLKDLPHRMSLDPALDAEVQAFLAVAPPPATDREGQRTYARRTEALVEKCLGTVDAELTRTTEARFSLGDANSLQRKLIADPRQQAGALVTELKNRLGADRGRWSQRTKDQAQDVLDRLDEQLRTLSTHYEAAAAEVTVRVDDGWLRQTFAWLDRVLSQWAEHHLQIVAAKTDLAAGPALKDLEKHLGTPVSARLGPPLPVNLRSLASDAPPLAHREELPTRAEAFFESLKGGLNTVAMLAGMVIVPVVGFFSDQQPIHVRAMIMGACVAPIFGFAGWATGRQRRKAVLKTEEKALGALRKEFEAYLRNRIERFRVELERHAGEYVNSAQAAYVLACDHAVASSFAERESQVARELARVQVESDRLSDRIMALKQLRGALNGQLLVEVRKKLRELEVAAP